MMSSRRKACDRCIRGKRRCDSKRPCTRCARRGLKCTFEPQEGPGCSPKSIPSCSKLLSPKLPDTIEGLQPIGPCLNNVASELLVPQSIMTGIGDGDDYRIFNNPSPITINQMSPLRLHSCVRRLQKCITDMAQDSQASFLKIPIMSGPEDFDSSLDDALLACTAYQSRTRRNCVSLNRTLYRSFLKLIHRLRTSLKFQERLSTIQAILLFQIMFFFGDDDKLRQLAESHMDVVQASVQLLQRDLIEQTSCIAALIEIDIMACQYQKWLLLESGRRTILAHFFIQGVYHLLENGYCDQVPYMAPLPLTVEGELWDARSEEEWSQVMYARKISTAVLVKPLADAVNIWTANDYERMDDFQLMLLDACRGAPPGR